jgi:hypothetical protein
MAQKGTTRLYTEPVRKGTTELHQAVAKPSQEDAGFNPLDEQGQNLQD